MPIHSNVYEKLRPGNINATDDIIPHKINIGEDEGYNDAFSKTKADANANSMPNVITAVFLTLNPMTYFLYVTTVQLIDNNKNIRFAVIGIFSQSSAIGLAAADAPKRALDATGIKTENAANGSRLKLEMA